MNFWIGLAVVLLGGVLTFRSVRTGPGHSSSELQGLRLDTLIQNVREELVKQDLARVERGDAPLFVLKSFDVELNFVIKQVKSAGGSVEHVPIAVEASASLERERVQKIVLRYDALNATEGGTVEGGAAKRPRSTGQQLSPETRK